MIIDNSRKNGVPYGIRTRVAAVKGRCPRPLDERDALSLVPKTGCYIMDSLPKKQALLCKKLKKVNL